MDESDPRGPGGSVRLSLGRVDERAAPHCGRVPRLQRRLSLSHLTERWTCLAGVGLNPFRLSFLFFVTSGVWGVRGF